MSFFETLFDEIGRRLRDVDAATLDAVCQRLVDAQARNRKVIVAGNGGSAAIASHVAVDLSKAAGVRATCFNEPNLITCFANDFGYEHWLAKAVESFGDEGDVAVLISSSGQSPNIVNAAHASKARGLSVVTLSGFAATNPLRQLGDQNLWTDSRDYNVVETTHQTWLLACVNQIVETSAGGRA